MTTATELDQRDQTIRDEREAAFNEQAGPRVGDYVRLPDGALHRFSYHWGDRLQHSAGGSFYLGKHYVDFSGSLDPAIPADRLHDTGETRSGSVWFFHHDYWTAHNGVAAEITFRVYEYRP